MTSKQCSPVLSSNNANMLTNLVRTISVAAILLVVGGFSAVGAQTVTGSIGKGEVTRGKKARATVILDIPHDLHTNSNDPGSEYAIPTTVKVAPVSGVKIGTIVYPRGMNKKFEFSEKALNVYEGRIVFSFDVTVSRGYQKPTVEIEATVRYQACTNEVCYPPKSKPVKLTAKVK